MLSRFSAARRKAVRSRESARSGRGWGSVCQENVIPLGAVRSRPKAAQAWARSAQETVWAEVAGENPVVMAWRWVT